MNTLTLGQRIASLKPGQELRLGGDAKDAKVWTTVERSGDGRVIRYVRHTPNSSAVFKTESAAQ